MSRRKKIIKKKIINNDILTLSEFLAIPNIISGGVSKNTVFYTEEDICTDDIYLISQFFLHNDSQRRKEISTCLKKNCQIFDKIFLLNERIYSMEEMEIYEEEFQKIEQIIIGERISYKSFLDFCKNKNIKGYFILSNADIFFDSTITNLRKGFLKLSKVKYMQFLDMK